MTMKKRIEPPHETPEYKAQRPVRYNYDRATLYPEHLLTGNELRDWTVRVKPMLKQFKINIADVRESYASLSHEFNFKKLDKGRPIFIRIANGNIVSSEMFKIPENAVYRKPSLIVDEDDILELNRLWLKKRTMPKKIAALIPPKTKKEEKQYKHRLKILQNMYKTVNKYVENLELRMRKKDAEYRAVN